MQIYINTIPMDPSWGSKSWKQIHANWTLERDIGAYSIEVQIGSNAVFLESTMLKSWKLHRFFIGLASNANTSHRNKKPENHRLKTYTKRPNGYVSRRVQIVGSPTTETGTVFLGREIFGIQVAPLAQTQTFSAVQSPWGNDTHTNREKTHMETGWERFFWGVKMVLSIYSTSKRMKGLLCNPSWNRTSEYWCLKTLDTSISITCILCILCIDTCSFMSDMQ